jgi:Ran GTPase-activating protein (RanGAP) involved in mRNA processing and transport
MPTRITLNAGGKRTDVLRAVEARAIVARFTQELARHPDQVAHVFDLSCRSWTIEAIEILAPFLEENGKKVCCANLDDIIAGRMTDEGLAVTERLAQAFANSKLIEVSMNDNAMGPRGLSRINLLFNSPLQRLYFSNCGLSEESMKMLKDAVLGNDGRIAKSLTDLVLDKNMIGKEGAKLVGDFLKSCRKLQYFSYAGCRPEREGSKAICEGIRDLTQDNDSVRLRHLNLDDCTIGDSEDDAVQPLSEALTKCPQLRYFNLRSGDAEIGGLEMLVRGLQASGAQLTHLDLGKFPLQECVYSIYSFSHTFSLHIAFFRIEW